MIGCMEIQLWVGQESGVWFWNFWDIYELGSGFGGWVLWGDEDVVLFYELGNMLLMLCIVVDYGNWLIWMGYKDGKIRLWKMDQNLMDDLMLFREGLFWQVYKGFVLFMVMFCYGKFLFGFILFLMQLVLMFVILIVFIIMEIIYLIGLNSLGVDVVYVLSFDFCNDWIIVGGGCF